MAILAVVSPLRDAVNQLALVPNINSYCRRNLFNIFYENLGAFLSPFLYFINLNFKGQVWEMQRDEKKIILHLKKEKNKYQLKLSKVNLYSNLRRLATVSSSFPITILWWINTLFIKKCCIIVFRHCWINNDNLYGLTGYHNNSTT